MSSNCATSLSIGCLFCCKCCNTDKLRSVFAYLPPQYASYTIEDESEGNGNGRVVYVLEKLKSLPGHQRAIESCFVHWVENRCNQRIPLVWVAEHYADNITNISGASASRRSSNTMDNPRLPDDALSEPDGEPPGQSSVEDCPSQDTPEAVEDGASIDEQLYVVIHCHGNATDIGLMMGTYWELAYRLGVVVVGVEYSGYGVATGEPTLANTYADVEAAYDLAIDWGVPPERIVVYGQSVGSGPAMWLASKHKLAGIILHSPLLSGIKAIDPDPASCCRPSCVFKCFDFYPNDERIAGISCPALILHGKLDEVVPFYHGDNLYKLVPDEFKFPAYFPQQAGHHDIAEVDPEQYYSKLKQFIAELEDRRTGVLPSRTSKLDRDDSSTAVAPSQIGMTEFCDGIDDDKFMSKELAVFPAQDWVPFNHGPCVEHHSFEHSDQHLDDPLKYDDALSSCEKEHGILGGDMQTSPSEQPSELLQPSLAEAPVAGKRRMQSL